MLDSHPLSSSNLVYQVVFTILGGWAVVIFGAKTAFS